MLEYCPRATKLGIGLGNRVIETVEERMSNSGQERNKWHASRVKVTVRLGRGGRS